VESAVISDQELQEIIHLFRTYFSRREPSMAEDLMCQGLFELAGSLARAQSRADQVRNVRAYAYEIARRVWAQWVDEQVKERDFLHRFSEQLAVQGSVSAVRTFDPCLEQSLARLSRLEQDLVRRSEVEGWEMTELAAQYRLNASTARVTKHRAMRKLRKLYEDCVNAKGNK
jgi:RNA polymerase sigma factor (sigma-70 family)